MSGTHSRRADRSFDILLIEGEPDDISPFIDSFRETDATEEVHIVTDGDDALDFIHRRGSYAQTPRPDLIILDLHVPGMDGEQFLKERNEQPEFHRIPILVFTKSKSAEVVARSYELQANAYLEKPSTPEKFVALAQAIEDFWLKQAHLPPK